MTPIGLGALNANLLVYIENTPPLAAYTNLNTLKALSIGEISRIVEQTGNHWRKIFNIYAKIGFFSTINSSTTWQEYRDNVLLQSHSSERLLFSPPDINKLPEKNISIIMGKTYATKLNIAQQCLWVSEHFAIHKEKRLIISPYFDYRQLSNQKIESLLQLIKSFDENN